MAHSHPLVCVHVSMRCALGAKNSQSPAHACALVSLGTDAGVAPLTKRLTHSLTKAVNGWQYLSIWVDTPAEHSNARGVGTNTVTA